MGLVPGLQWTLADLTLKSKEFRTTSKIHTNLHIAWAKTSRESIIRKKYKKFLQNTGHLSRKITQVAHQTAFPYWSKDPAEKTSQTVNPEIAFLPLLYTAAAQLPTVAVDVQQIHTSCEPSLSHQQHHASSSNQQIRQVSGSDNPDGSSRCGLALGNHLHLVHFHASSRPSVCRLLVRRSRYFPCLTFGEKKVNICLQDTRLQAETSSYNVDLWWQSTTMVAICLWTSCRRFEKFASKSENFSCLCLSKISHKMQWQSEGLNLKRQSQRLHCLTSLPLHHLRPHGDW